MCECIKKLAGLGYVEPNLLSSGTYFTYAHKLDKKQNVKVDKDKPLFKINFCPNCGSKLD